MSSLGRTTTQSQNKLTWCQGLHHIVDTANSMELQDFAGFSRWLHGLLLQLVSGLHHSFWLSGVWGQHVLELSIPKYEAQTKASC